MGNQLFGIYGYDGQDIGQRYLPASYGQAYGNTGFQQAQGTDVGNLLCRAGTMNVFTVNLGYRVIDGIDYYYGYFTLLSDGITSGSISPNTLLGYTITGFYNGFTRPNSLRFIIKILNDQQPWTGLNVTFLDDNTTWNMPRYQRFYGFYSRELSDYILKRRYEQGIRQVQARITVY